MVTLGAALESLPNIGPQSCAMLARAGIRTPEELRRLGSVRAFAREHRTSLLLAWDAYQRTHPGIDA